MTATDQTNEDRVVTAVKQFMELLDAGMAPAQEDFLRQHADIAEDLRPAIEGLALIHRTEASGPALPLGSVESPIKAIAGKPVGDFQIIREIGRGGMGVVYEATQLSLNRNVALKVLPLASGLDEIRLQRFRNEANAAGTLHHTNIVPVYAVGSDRGIHFYAMQLIDGITVADLLNKLKQTNHDDSVPMDSLTNRDTKHSIDHSQGDAPRDSQFDTVAKYSTMVDSNSVKQADYYRTVVRMVQQASLAIEHAHQYGVIHRDIKPANLLLDSMGKIWVADFGLAQVQAEQSNLTRTGDPLGTLRYMSPEQATGHRAELDHRTDIYSLGATLYELLTLHPAIPDGSFHEMLDRVAHIEPPTPRSIVSELPTELDTIVCKAISKIPAERYATASEFAADLQAWLDDKPITARPPGLLDRLAKWRRRNSRLVAATSLFLLASTIGLTITTLMIWSQQQQTSAALDRETQQRKIAEERFGLARRAVDTFSMQSETELSHRANLQDLRRSFLETSLSFYQDFLSERTDDALLADNLLVTRDRVRQMVHELEVLDNIDAIKQISDTRVRSEVGLSEEVCSQLLMAVKEFESRRESLSDQFIGGLQSENNDVSNMLLQFDSTTRQWLTPARLERLRQIGRQRRIPVTFKSSEIIRALNLTTEQVERIDQIVEDTKPALSPLRRGGREQRTGGSMRSAGGRVSRPGGPFEARSRAARQNALRLILEILTAQQQEAWKELVGEPILW